MMKTLIYTLLFAASSLSAQAQFTVAPFGASGAGAPPVGESRTSKCGAQGCLEIKVRPYCFGTNLRAYAVDKQLRPDQPIEMHIELTDADDASKKDNFKVVFPAMLTYPSDGVRTDCVMNSGSGSVRNVSCMVPGLSQPVDYKVTNWKLNKNPSCYAGGGSHGQEYCDYAAVQTDAELQSSVSADPTIKCLYKFNGSYQVINDSVSCVLPSQAPTYSAQVKVYNSADQDITSSVNLNAFTNSINFVFSQALQSRSQVQKVKHGQPITVKPPLHKISYKQGGRDITAVVETEKFDESNANNSFTSIVKFPGQEGFCGGFYSPLMLFFDEQVPQFNGVSTFPLYGMKDGARVNWPEKDAPGYFLVNLGKDAKEVTSYTQLFGKTDKFENGFEALKVYDSNKDDVIDAKDPIFKSLVLWRDSNSNGNSENGEIVSLKSKGVVSIDLKYSTRDVTKFDSRARAKEKSKFSFKGANGKVVKSNIYDVWLAPID